jgi:hypothetical protein
LLQALRLRDTGTRVLLASRRSLRREDGHLLDLSARHALAALLALLASVVTAPSEASAGKRHGRRIATLHPVADTYVEAGEEAAWDHGGTRWLDADASPAGVTYLKFDLSGVTAPIAHARLLLSVTNSSDDAGRVYRVHDTSWAEGGGEQSEAPGLCWPDVDRNRDGRLDAAERWPSPARAPTV